MHSKYYASRKANFDMEYFSVQIFELKGLEAHLKIISLHPLTDISFMIISRKCHRDIFRNLYK